MDVWGLFLNIPISSIYETSLGSNTYIPCVDLDKGLLRCPSLYSIYSSLPLISRFLLSLSKKRVMVTYLKLNKLNLKKKKLIMFDTWIDI